MKIVVLGANGRTGQHVVSMALEQGMEVTAVVRSPEKALDIKHERLSIAIGDPCSADFLKSAMRDKDALISALGGRSPSKKATSVYYLSADAIIEAAWDVGVHRVLVTSTALLFPEQTFLGQMLRVIVPNVVRSAERMEQSLMNSGLQWTSARVGFLTDAPDNTYRANKNSLPEDGSSVSRKALAQFLVNAVGDRTTMGAVFGVSKTTN